MYKIAIILFFLVLSSPGLRTQISSMQEILLKSLAEANETSVNDVNCSTQALQDKRRIGWRKRAGRFFRALLQKVQMIGIVLVDRFLGNPSWNGMVGRGILSLAEQFLRLVCSFLAALPAIRSPPSFREELRAGVRFLSLEGNVTSLVVSGFESIRPFQVLPSSQGDIVTVSAFDHLQTLVHGNFETVVGPQKGLHHAGSHIIDQTYELQNVELIVVWNCRMPQGSIVKYAVEGVGLDHRSLKMSLISVEAKVHKVRLKHSSGFGPRGFMKLLSKTLSRKLRKITEMVIANSLHAALSRNLTSLVEDLRSNKGIERSEK